MVYSNSSAVVVLLILNLGGTLAEQGVVVASEPAQARDTLEKKLDRAVAQSLDSHPIPGLAVGVMKDGKVVYAKGFGVLDIRTDKPVTTESLFHVASLSKTFVATAIMQLVERKNLDLDAPVAKYLPYFQLGDERAKHITIRQLLTHTSGMPDVEDYQWDAPEVDAGALERYVRSLASAELIAPPGQRYHYSNMAYEVLGDVIAKVSGESFEAYVKAHVLDPLDMRNSTFLIEEMDAGLRTTPHVGRREPKISLIYPYHRAHAPSSTLHSSVKELCNWIIANVNRGRFKGRRLLNETSFDELWKPHTEGRRGIKIGLAWMIAQRPYGLLVFHGGRDLGFGSHVTLLPDTRSGLVILTNTSDFPVPLLRNAIMKTVFGDTGK